MGTSPFAWFFGSRLTCNYTEFLPPKPLLLISVKLPSPAFYAEFIWYKTPLERFLPKHRAGSNAGVPSPHDRTELDVLPWRMDVAGGAFGHSTKDAPDGRTSRGVFLFYG